MSTDNFIDIVFPAKNEKKFFSIALKLGIKSLCLVYAGKKINDATLVAAKEEASRLGIKAYFAVLDGNKLDPLSKADFRLAKANENTRRILENASADIIFGFESLERKDSLHYRRSGLNQVLCEFARKNKIHIGIPFSDLLNSNEVYRSVMKGRIAQNIMLCRKYKVSMVAASFASSPYEMRCPHDMRSLLLSLGMDGKLANETMANVKSLIDSKASLASGKTLAEGIEIVD